VTRDQILNYGQYMTAGHGITPISLFFRCQEKTGDSRKYFVKAVGIELMM
jgi:hypothetical protein